MDLPSMRTRLRRDLRDTDPANERWPDEALDRHIERALRELSLAAPLEATATLRTVAGSRDLSVATLTDRVSVDAVEYPAGLYPPSRPPFSLWGDTLTIEVGGAPGGGEAVTVHYSKLHTLNDAGSTLPRALDDLVATGAGAYAALRVGLVRGQPRERRRRGDVAALPRLGAGAARRVRPRAGEARPRTARPLARALLAARRVGRGDMRALTPTLRAAQQSASTEPYLRVRLYDRDAGAIRLRWQRVHDGAEPDGPCALAGAGDGSLLRARIDPATGLLSRQRIARPRSGRGLCGLDRRRRLWRSRRASGSPPPAVARCS